MANTFIVQTNLLIEFPTRPRGVCLEAMCPFLKSVTTAKIQLLQAEKELQSNESAASDWACAWYN